ncbi:MAG: YggT family protein [Rhabdochlamydiaceae bacterium]|nr:YggT family protein [Rhabdochlamydiaceae bacterium]
MLLVATWVQYFFKAYILMLLVRVIGSWFPSFARNPIMIFCYKMTEPYLALIRRILPPIGGTLDLSPLLGFFILEIVQSLLISLLIRL